jgi:hypothetical protein
LVPEEACESTDLADTLVWQHISNRSAAMA